jgi:shikimate dehydrogenase
MLLWRGAVVKHQPARFAVVGDPVAHSASPRLFSALGRHLGVALDYRAERVEAAALPGFLNAVRRGAYQGLSVTLPHKEAALRLADSAAPSARAVGAANTLVVRDGRLEAHNTDGVGLLSALAGQGVSLKDARVLVLGAGGAARAAVQASQAAGAASVWVSNRTQERAQRLAEAFDAVAVPTSGLTHLLQDVDVLLQASAAGLSRPTESALPVGCVLHPRLTVLEMVYQPLETQLLRDARAAGARGIDGLWMLVHQALEQCRLWTGVEAAPEVAPALHAELVRGQA